MAGMTLLLVLLLSQAAATRPADGPASRPADVAEAGAAEEFPQPSPERTPAEVVALCVGALGENGPNDAGIALVWRHASPANREMTGPLGRFTAMVKRPPYAALVGHAGANLGRERVDEEAGLYDQLFTVTSPDGVERAFVWQLQRQPDGPLKGCWMTTGVIPLDAPPPPPPRVTI